jgi:uncharacterized membrane protein YhaH (DUF805 family)
VSRDARRSGLREADGQPKPIPIKQLLFSSKGRIGRRDFWRGQLCWLAFSAALTAFSRIGFDWERPGPAHLLYVLAGACFCLYAFVVVHAKRWEDLGKSGWHTLIILLPFVGPIWAYAMLGFVKGTPGSNRHGEAPAQPVLPDEDDLGNIPEAAWQQDGPAAEPETPAPTGGIPKPEPASVIPLSRAPPSGSPRSGRWGRLVRSWRGPRCFVTEAEKTWVEVNMLWLKTQFSVTPLRQATLVPGCDTLPDAWHGSGEEGVELVHRLCAYMGVNPGRIAVAYYSEAYEAGMQRVPLYEGLHQGAAGLFIDPSGSEGRFLLALEAAGLARPEALVATICHELGHVRLLGERRLTHDDADHESRTDLLTVYFGAGIFTANSVFRFQQWQDANYSYWQTSSMGYLSEPVLAYALAAYAWMRGEPAPAWARHLRSNITPYFEEDLYFLFRTRKTTLPCAVS